MLQSNLVVLAGGFGTRLRQAVSDVPKPLAPVCGKPYLQYAIERWVEQGVASMTFLLHHQAHLVEEFLQSLHGAAWLQGCRLRSLTEPRPLGTGGAVAYAAHQLHFSGSFLVSNADTWLGSGIEKIARAAAPAIGVVHVDSTARYGRVRVQENKVTAFDEKQSSAGGGWVNAGLYHLDSACFNDWNGQPFSLERELFPQLVNRGRLTAVPLQTEFIDIGVPEDYFRFCRWIESGAATGGL